MGTALFLALVCSVGVAPTIEVARHPLALEQLPAAARATLERKSHGRMPHQLSQVYDSNGLVYYEAIVKRPFRYAHDIAIAANGDVLRDWKIERPSGTGP